MESAALQQETEGLRLVVATLRQEGERALEEKRVLQQLLHHVQGRCQQKIKVNTLYRVPVCRLGTRI